MNSAELNEKDKLLPLEEVCELLGGISRQTVWRYRNYEVSPLIATKMGKQLLFKKTDVEAFIEAHRSTVTQTA